MKNSRIFIGLLLITLISVLALGGCATSPALSGQTGPQGPPGAAGAGVTGASVNSTGHLVLTLSNGQTIDAGSVAAPQSGPSTGSAGSFAAIVPRVEPSVVRVDVNIPGGTDSGSGTIVDKRGYIVTNEHVIHESQGIQVTLMDGTVLGASVIASDVNQDIAIIKLTSARTDFPVITIGTMTDVLVGEAVMAGGFPAGTLLPGPASFTMGIVSAMRNQSGFDYVQIDASINPGSSGGCLVTIDGKMIGVPTSGLTPARQDFESINLCVPINRVSAFIAQNVK